MRARGSGRWAVALVIVVALSRLGLPALLTAGARAGGLGVGAVLVLAGGGLALVFTAVYDGPRAVGRLLTRRGSRPASATGSRVGGRG